MRDFMNPKFMLDTNICVYLMKHQPPEVRERFAQCFVGDIIISAVTLAELEFGIACSSTAAQESNRSALESCSTTSRLRLLMHKLPRLMAPSAPLTKVTTEMPWTNSSHLMRSL